VGLDKAQTGTRGLACGGHRHVLTYPRAGCGRRLDQTEVVVSSRNELFGVPPRQLARSCGSCDGIHDYVLPQRGQPLKALFTRLAGRKGTALAVKAGGRGDVTQTHRLWTATKGSNVSSPVYYEGHLYFAHESRGTPIVTRENRETVYEQRLEPRPRAYLRLAAGRGRKESTWSTDRRALTSCWPSLSSRS